MPGTFKEQWGKVSEGEIRATNETNPKRLGASDTQSTGKGLAEVRENNLSQAGEKRRRVGGLSEEKGGD